MVYITILLQVSKHHTHLQDRGEVVKPSEERRINVGSPMPFVDVVSLVYFPLVLHGLHRGSLSTGVTSPAQSKNLSVGLQKKPHMGVSLSLVIWISFPDFFCCLLLLSQTYTLHFERNKMLFPCNQRTSGNRTFIKTKASQNSCFNRLSSNVEAGRSVSQASPYNPSLQICIRG